MKPREPGRTWARILTSLCLCALVVVSLSCSERAPKPNGPRVEVTVGPGMGIRALADTLAAKQVIGSKPLFLFYAWYYNYAPRIRPNRYRLQIGTKPRRVLRLLSGEEAPLDLGTGTRWRYRELC